MKNLKAPPKDRGFFNVYARLAKSVNRSGYFAQFVSAATEIGIIYSLSFKALFDLFPVLAPFLALLTAIIGTAVIEIGLRLLIPYSVDAVLYKRFKGLHLPMTIAIWLLALVLSLTSGLLSFKNSGEIVDTFTPEAEEVNTTKADSSHHSEIGQISAIFQQDSAMIAERYNTSIAAENGAYFGKIEAEKQDLINWGRREVRTGKSYVSKKDAIRVTVAQLEAERVGKVAALEADRGEALAVARTDYKNELAGLKKGYKGELTKIEAANDKAAADRADTISKYGGGLGWFTVVCLFIFMASVILDRIHYKGSGIEEKIQLSQYDISPSAWIEAKEAFRERIGYLLRRRIFDFAEGTPPAPLPMAAGELYDQTKLTDKVVELQTEETEEQDDNIIYIKPRRQIGFRNSSAFYSTANTKREEAKSTHETPDLRHIKQRLKFYKKRLGSHQQKAIAQTRKHGNVKKRTEDAIANNQQWVDHYTSLLQNLTNSNQ